MAKRKNSEGIPFDLIIEIFMRLPAKSIARFRCVSKLCSSTFRSAVFTDLFFEISSSRPKLLFTCMLDGKTHFFSSPNPSNTSEHLFTDPHMSFSINCPSNVCRPVNGLVCGLSQYFLKGRLITFPLICNPSTGKFIILPKVETRTRRIVISYFGYDQVQKEFKVLCMTQPNVGSFCQEHRVLTLGTWSSDWRMVKCNIPHYPFNVDTRHYGICINGVLYYLGVFREGHNRLNGIVSFDIRSEKFKLIKKDQAMDVDRVSTLVNYKGKLATIHHCVDDCTSFQLWILEDINKHQWSQHVYYLPPSWIYTIQAETKLTLKIVGMTSIGEIVLSTDYIAESFYLIYYNPESNTVTPVEVQGLGGFKEEKAYIFLDHVENVKFKASGWGHGLLV